MKANRKFLNNDDEAVSPVIAVILMVAITVVLAATVYVWVSGFGSNSSQPAKTLALTSNGAIADCGTDGVTAGAYECKSYVVASASPGLRWQDLTFTIDGADQTIAAENCDATVEPEDPNTYSGCDGDGTAEATGAVIQAGNLVEFHGAASSLSGGTLRVLDSASNSIILTLTFS